MRRRSGRPGRRPWRRCRSRAGPEDGRLPAVGRADHCCLGHRAPYPGLLRRPCQGWAICCTAPTLRQNARTPPRCCCWSPSTLTGLRLRKPASQQAPCSWTGQRHHPSRVITVPDQPSGPGPEHQPPALMTVPPRFATSVCRPPPGWGPGFGRPRAGCQAGSPGCCSINTVARMSSREPTVRSA
jgi:hypothetical protein